MKIAIDGRPLQGQLSGVGKYVLSLVFNLANCIPDATIVIFTNRPLDISFTSPNIIIKQDLKFRKIKPLIWCKFFLGRLIKKESFDFLISGGTFTPIQKLKCSTIVVVHDLNHIYAKETMGKLHYLTHFLFFKNDVGAAQYVITNSKGTAEKLLKNYGISTNYILHPPISSCYKLINEADVKRRLEELNINFPYILAVATQEPRKNLEKTVKAFKNLKANNMLADIKLLLVGGKGWKNDKLNQLIASENNIIRAGYVAEDDLPFIYNGATSFVFPSTYEGYGMPATEAVLCGLKPVVTDIKELHEATLGYAYYVAPENSKQYEENIINSIKESSHLLTPNIIAFTERFDTEFNDFLTILLDKS